MTVALVPREPPPRSVKSHRERPHRDPQRLGGLGTSQPIPSDQHQELLIGGPERPQRADRRRRTIVTDSRPHARNLLAADPVTQRRAAMLTPPLVGQHLARNTQQPRQRLRRNIINPPPSDHKHVREDVIRCLPRRAATRVREHCSRVLPIQLLKLLSRHLAE